MSENDMVPARFDTFEVRDGERGIKFQLGRNTKLTREQVEELARELHQRVECQRVEVFAPRNTLAGPTSWIIMVVDPTSVELDDESRWFEICSEIGIQLP